MNLQFGVHRVFLRLKVRERLCDFVSGITVEVIPGGKD